MSFEQLKRQIEWFTGAGVDSFNLAVLGEDAMLNHSLPRTAPAALAAAGWAWARNLEGLSVYLRPATGPAWPMLLLDDLPHRRALAVAGKYAALVVETSLDNCQVWIKTNAALTIAERLAVQSALAGLIAADPCSVSGDHFGRAAGFRNRKPGRGGWLVDVLAATAAPALDPAPYLRAALEYYSLPQAEGRQAGGRASSGGSVRGAAADSSADEFGWACGWLRQGFDFEEGKQRLAARAMERGKRKNYQAAETYALMTFRRAANCI